MVLITLVCNILEPCWFTCAAPLNLNAGCCEEFLSPYSVTRQNVSNICIFLLRKQCFCMIALSSSTDYSLTETYYAFCVLFSPFPLVCYIHQRELLSPTENTAWNTPSAASPFMPWLLDITLHHHVTHLQNVHRSEWLTSAGYRRQGPHHWGSRPVAWGDGPLLCQPATNEPPCGCERKLLNLTQTLCVAQWEHSGKVLPISLPTVTEIWDWIRKLQILRDMLKTLDTVSAEMTLQF